MVVVQVPDEKEKVLEIVKKPSSKKGKRFLEMNRKDFLIAMGLMLGSGKVLSDTVKEIYYESKKWDIYNVLPDYLQEIYVEGDFVWEDNVKRRINCKGNGIILKGKYLTVSHIPTLDFINGDVIFKQLGYKDTMKLFIELGGVNPIPFPKGFENIQVKLHNQVLQEKFLSREKEIAIYDLPKHLQILEFPSEISTELKNGEEVYLIVGGVRTKGVKKGFVHKKDFKGRINDVNNREVGLRLVENYFTIDCLVAPGDSGSPVVNKNCELVGLGVGTEVDLNKNSTGVGLVKKIESFLKYV